MWSGWSSGGEGSGQGQVGGGGGGAFIKKYGCNQPLWPNG